MASSVRSGVSNRGELLEPGERTLGGFFVAPPAMNEPELIISVLVIGSVGDRLLEKIGCAVEVRAQLGDLGESEVDYRESWISFDRLPEDLLRPIELVAAKSDEAHEVIGLHQVGVALDGFRKKL